MLTIILILCAIMAFSLFMAACCHASAKADERARRMRYEDECATVHYRDGVTAAPKSNDDAQRFLPDDSSPGDYFIYDPERDLYAPFGDGESIRDDALRCLLNGKLCAGNLKWITREKAYRE